MVLVRERDWSFPAPTEGADKHILPAYDPIFEHEGQTFAEMDPMFKVRQTLPTLQTRPASHLL